MIFVNIVAKPKIRAKEYGAKPKNEFKFHL